MAQRRMFSLQIVDTDAFLDMPQSSQLLYFHLAMRADDDGFIGNPKKVARIVGANDDDLKVLLRKRFLLSFDTGVVVVKHWRIHNLIRGDRYNETKYIDEKSTLQLKENGSYTELATHRIPTGNQMATQVRLGKVRLGKESIEKNTHGEFKNVLLTNDEHSKLVDSLNAVAVDNLITELDGYIQSTGKKYKDHYATLQNWARRRIQEHAAKSMSTKPKMI